MKILFVSTILLVGLCACNSDEDVKNEFDNKISTETSSIVKRINHINDSIRPSMFLSRAKPKDVLLASADIAGAYEGGRLGIRGGSFLGSFFPGIGTFGGGFIGGLIGASIGSIGCSYVEYCRQNSGGYTIILPTVDDVTKAYCLNYDLKCDNGSYSDLESVLELPLMLDSLENVGKYHNLTLTTLIKQNGGVMTLDSGNDLSKPSDDFIKDHGTLLQLSDFERAVIYSDDYIKSFDQSMYAIFNGESNGMSDDSVSRIILDFYVDALGYFNGPVDINNVVDLTNEYISVIDSSDELSDIEKYNLYIALSVGAYSYKFWANYNEENN